MKKEVLLALHQRPIAYYPIYRTITGSTTAAILLSQLLYWYSACGGRKFYKTDSEIMEETQLTEKELRNAKNCLKQFDFIFIELEGLPRRTFYSFNEENLYRHLVRTSDAQRAELATPKGRRNNVRKGVAITENTTEITSKESLTPETAFDFKNQLKKLNLFEDTVENRKTLWTAYEKILTADFFLAQWEVVSIGLPQPPDRNAVVQDWVIKGDFYPVNTFQLNKIRGWIETAGRVKPKNSKNGTHSNQKIQSPDPNSDYYKNAPTLGYARDQK